MKKLFLFFVVILTFGVFIGCGKDAPADPVIEDPETSLFEMAEPVYVDPGVLVLKEPQLAVDVAIYCNDIELPQDTAMARSSETEDTELNSDIVTGGSSILTKFIRCSCDQHSANTYTGTSVAYNKGISRIGIM